MAAERKIENSSLTFAQAVADEQAQFVSLMKTIEDDHLKIANRRTGNLMREYEVDHNGNKTDKFSYIPFLPEWENVHLEEISRLNHFKDAARYIHWSHQATFADNPEAPDSQKAQLLADVYWGTKHFVVQAGAKVTKEGSIASGVLEIYNKIVPQIQTSIEKQPEVWKTINTTGKVPLPKAA